MIIPIKRLATVLKQCAQAFNKCSHSSATSAYIQAQFLYFSRSCVEARVATYLSRFTWSPQFLHSFTSSIRSALLSGPYRYLRLSYPYTIFPLHFREDGSLREWAIIELQGDLKHSSGDNTKGQFIGDLHFEGRTPILIIGVHVLTGKEVVLDKPFAVLEKIRQTEDGSAVDPEAEDAPSTTEYVVKAVVKRKMIFKTRPKPIVTDVPICK